MVMAVGGRLSEGSPACVASGAGVGATVEKERDDWEVSLSTGAEQSVSVTNSSCVQDAASVQQARGQLQVTFMAHA